jgi:hypothetical protein
VQEGCGRWPSGGPSKTRVHTRAPQGAAVRSGLLLPHQVSTVAAAETKILGHGFREKLQQFGLDPGNVALRVDAANAFNVVPRAEILERVCEQSPPAAQYVHAIYGEQPYVVAGTTLLLSRQGTQQRDPLGMLLFALAIQPLVLRIQSECDLEQPLIHRRRHSSWVGRRGCQGVFYSQGRRAEVLLLPGAAQDQPVVADYGLCAVATIVRLPSGDRRQRPSASRDRPCWLPSWLRRVCEAASHCEERQG